MYIGWMNCQGGKGDEHLHDSAVMINALVQYAEEAKLRADWLKSELGVDHKVMGMSWAEFISLLALIVTVTASVAIARVQHRHNKQSQEKAQTLSVWEEYLGLHQTITRALEVMHEPLNTDQSGFSTVQRVRAWLDGIASLDSIGELDRRMLKALTISGPLKAFMDKLSEAVDKLAAEKMDDSRRRRWLSDYQQELNNSRQITLFLERIKGAR